MSLSGRTRNRFNRYSRPFYLLLALLALPTSSCQPSVLGYVSTSMQVEVQLDPSALGHDQLKFIWGGQWQNDTVFNGTGDQVAGGTVILAPASQQALTRFPQSGLIRPGVWEITVSVTPPGSNPILDTFCEVEIGPGQGTVHFTQYLNGCSSPMGGSVPLH